ncbi:MAG: S-layer homology domain-containing protein [bacterium]
MKKTAFLAVFIALFVAGTAFGKTLVDVPSGHWAADAVQKLVDEGIIEGYPDGTFGGQRSLTRYEYAMVVQRLLDKLENEYCTKEDCAPGKAETVEEAQDLDEVKDIVKKLAAEFKDELAALKVKVDENAEKIAVLEDRMDKAFFNLNVTGSIRQRIDIPNSELNAANFATSYFTRMYDPAGVYAAGASVDLNAGYELVPYLQFTGEVGDNADFSIGLKQYIVNMIDTGPVPVNSSDLDIEHAYVKLDFTESAKELDLLTVTSGYQKVVFGPYGMLLDNTGLESVAGITAAVGKDRVQLTGTGMLLDTGQIGIGLSGLGSAQKDVLFAGRLDIDLDDVLVGVNYLGNGYDDEKGWGADINANLLKNSRFLTGLKAEYLTITDTSFGVSPGANTDDYSYAVGLDVYETDISKVTLSYADLPAAPTLTSMDGSPFTEYDASCPTGLDICGNQQGQMYSFESGRNVFPAGFKGFGLEASHTVLGDVTLAAKAIYGDFAGGVHPANATVDLEGYDYPAFGAFSITKPVNEDSTFRVEYMQQGVDPMILNRVRGELLINF